MPEAERSSRRAWTVVAIGLGVVVAVVAAALTLGRDEPWRRSGPPIVVSAWAPYWQTEEALGSFVEQADVFGDVSLAGWSVREGGTVQPYDQLPADAVSSFRARAEAFRVPFLGTVFDEMGEGGMGELLADPSRRAAHVADLTALVATHGLDGLDIDYEVFAFSDDRATWAATQPNWLAFVQELADVLHADGKLLVVSVPPVYDDGSPADTGFWVYGHERLGEIVDRIRLMTYDYSVPEPGPIAPIWWVRSVVEAMTELVPGEKLDLGVPAYGRDWVLSVAGTCPADQQPASRSVSIRTVAELVATVGAAPVWDSGAAEWGFDYSSTLTGADAAGATVSCTVARTVRYLDGTAIGLRAWIAHRHDLHGVAVWALGNDDGAVWTAVRAVRAGTEPVPPTTVPAMTVPATTVPATTAQNVVVSTS